MQTEGSLPRSQEPCTCLNPKPDQFSPGPHLISWNYISKLFFYLCLGLPADLFPSNFPTKTIYARLFSATRAIRPAQTSVFFDAKHRQQLVLCRPFCVCDVAYM
jgi:hypothetical protein